MRRRSRRICSSSQAWQAGQPDRHLRRPRRLGPGIYGLSNHLLDTPWPKVTTGKSALSALLGGGGADLTAGLFDLLSDRTQVRDESLPRTGIGLAWERLLSSAFIASAEYGTRAVQRFP